MATQSEATAAPMTSEAADVGDEEGRGFAKRIVAEILDRSVAKYRGSQEGDVKTEEKVEEAGGGGGEDSAAPKSNYVNFDIAQTVIVSSREEADLEQETGDEPTARNEAAPENDGSRTPTGEL